MRRSTQICLNAKARLGMANYKGEEMENRPKQRPSVLI